MNEASGVKYDPGMTLDLDRQPDGRTELEIAGELALGLTDGRSDGARLSGGLTVDNVSSRFVVGGSLTASGTAECSRCLKEFTLEWEVPVELQVLRDVETDEGDGDSLVIRQRKGEVDLRESLRESTVLAFPQAPLCNEDCRGLCPDCGVDRNEIPCECADQNHDPRWDGLP